MSARNGELSARIKLTVPPLALSSNDVEVLAKHTAFGNLISPGSAFGEIISNLIAFCGIWSNEFAIIRDPKTRIKAYASITFLLNLKIYFSEFASK